MARALKAKKALMMDAERKQDTLQGRVSKKDLQIAIVIALKNPGFTAILSSPAPLSICGAQLSKPHVFPAK